MNISKGSLLPSTTPGAVADLTPTGQGTLRLPPGSLDHYRLAQLDDYSHASRGRGRWAFLWNPPLTFYVRARASHPTLPGTWGFGLWNAPLSLSLGFGGQRILPALPNAVWFFFASSENYLSLRNDLPANGALAATFRAPNLPTPLLAPGVLAIPLLLIRPAARLFRRVAASIVMQDAAAIDISLTEWHDYAFDWQIDKVIFRVDGRTVLDSPISPRGPLGMVIWMDNQFAAWRPDGRLQWGVLRCEEETWVEIEHLPIN